MFPMSLVSKFLRTSAAGTSTAVQGLHGTRTQEPSSSPSTVILRPGLISLHTLHSHPCYYFSLLPNELLVKQVKQARPSSPSPNTVHTHPNPQLQSGVWNISPKGFRCEPLGCEGTAASHMQEWKGCAECQTAPRPKMDSHSFTTQQCSWRHWIFLLIQHIN